MTQIPIGVQLYSVRHNLADDAQGTIQAVGEMGYAGVEFFGPPQESADTYRGWLADAGLACCGWHVPFHLMQDDTLAETIAFHKALGNHRLILPGIPADLRTSRADWQKLVPFFNGLAEALAKQNMVTGYHNHHHEFIPMDGERPWDTLFSQVDQRVVMQLDTGNGLFGGADILATMRRYPGRAKTVHLKPFDSRVDTSQDPHAGFGPLLGDDDTPWAEFIALCQGSGETEWYIVEYESDAYEPMNAIKRCLKNLQEMV